VSRDDRRDREQGGVPEVQDVEQQVRERAYELFVARTSAGEEGDEFLDWVAAEAEVLERRGARGVE
jgi:hypothetical protein